jgi:hypothetical protein
VPGGQFDDRLPIYLTVVVGVLDLDVPPFRQIGAVDLDDRVEPRVIPRGLWVRNVDFRLVRVGSCGNRTQSGHTAPHERGADAEASEQCSSTGESIVLLVSHHSCPRR